MQGRLAIVDTLPDRPHSALHDHPQGENVEDRRRGPADVGRRHREGLVPLGAAAVEECWSASSALVLERPFWRQTSVNLAARRAGLR
jgi:hypothetical protein